MPGSSPDGGRLERLGRAVGRRLDGPPGARPHGRAGVLDELRPQGVAGVSGHLVQGVERSQAHGVGAPRVERHLGQALERAVGLGRDARREVAADDADRRLAEIGIAVGRLEHAQRRRERAPVSDGLERPERARARRDGQVGREHVEQALHGAGADDRQARNRGLAAHLAVARELLDQAPDFRSGRGLDYHRLSRAG